MADNNGGAIRSLQMIVGGLLVVSDVLRVRGLTGRNRTETRSSELTNLAQTQLLGGLPKRIPRTLRLCSSWRRPQAGREQPSSPRLDSIFISVQRSAAMGPLGFGKTVPCGVD